MRSISFRLNRRGAILPLTIIVLAMMAVAVAITYGRISSERAVSGDMKAQQGAFAVAQSGLNRYMSTLNAKPAVPVGWPANPVLQTVNYNDLPGGIAQVDVAMLRDSVPTAMPLPAIYVITSRGRYTAAKRWNSRSPSAERTVAAFALWVPQPMDLDGALTTLGSLSYNGNSATLSGVDRCGSSGTKAGVVTPDGITTGFNHPEIIQGNPAGGAADLGDPYPATGTGSARNNVELDWAGISAGTAIPVDVNYPANAWPPMTAAPPALSMANWPVIRVNGNLTMPGSGNGILIVTGNLTWNGTPLKTWQGIILVGGSLTHNGAGNMYGAAISNLNVKLGAAPVPDDIGSGTKVYQYDSCSINRALGHVGRMQRVRNGWTDSWSSY